MNKTTIIIGLLILGGAVAALAANKKGSAPLIITDFDAAYDYKYETGRWFTHRKGETDWRDMQSILSEANYNLAISRLTDYLTRNGLTL